MWPQLVDYLQTFFVHRTLDGNLIFIHAPHTHSSAWKIWGTELISIEKEHFNEKFHL